MKKLIILMMLISASAFAKPKPVDPKIEEIKREQAKLQCLTEQSRFQMAYQQKQMQCQAQLSGYRQCISKMRDRQSSGTAKGALIGLGAAVLTGGASLLYTGVGALVGHSTSDEAPGECGSEPNCDYNVVAVAVKQETGLTQRSCQ